MEEEELRFLYHHLVLPPQLPCDGDQGKRANVKFLTDLVIQSCRAFTDLIDHEYHDTWSRIRRCIADFRALHSRTSALSSAELLEAFRDAADGNTVILHIALQNCCLVIRQAGNNAFVIESFETSPPAAEVLASKAALQWDFPSRAVKIPGSFFTDPSLQKELASFIEQASIENVKQFAATSTKAGTRAFENRDTTHPAIIGQLLMAILEANGHLHKTTLTRKRIKDDVCWTDGAEYPWRRSPIWLVLRVSIQRTLCSYLGNMVGTAHYKLFMAFLHCRLCDRIAQSNILPPDWLAFTRTKVARRIAKFQNQMEHLPTTDAGIAQKSFTRIEPTFSKSLNLANDRLERDWQSVRSLCTKIVAPLPKRADHGSLTFRLVNSRPFLQSIIREEVWGRRYIPAHLGGRNRTGNFTSHWAGQGSSESWDPIKYIELADFEKELRELARDIIRQPPHNEGESKCEMILQKMRVYFEAAFTAYVSDPEHLSAAVVLLFELWQALDTIALKLLPLLAEYNPEFPENLLWLVQTMDLEGMQRISSIEAYLESRRARANKSLSSIYGNITGDSFGPRYFDSDAGMQRTMAKIDQMEKEATIAKQEELKTKGEEYEQTLKEYTIATCLFFEDDVDPLIKHHDQRRCRKCYLERHLTRMRIAIHEAFLPSDESQAKGVVFELMLPQAFAFWREATWRLLKLARPDTISETPPRLLLREYTGLSRFSNGSRSSIGLASRTKSFHDTHYAFVPLPATIDKVCLAHGLRYGLFDTDSGIWTSAQLKTPSLASICAQPLPKKSSFASLEHCVRPSFDGKTMTANDIIASQTNCPKTLTVPEFLAFQDIRLGQMTPWLKLLRELAASNINFSSVETSILVSQLALLAGPSRSNDPLRATHWVFSDETFCISLAAQIRKRLTAIEANWREGQAIQCWLLLSLRMYFLATSTYAQQEARLLIMLVRNITRQWTRLLRREICNASDVATAQKRSQDALRAALICRRTYSIEAHDADAAFQPDALACFIECAISVKQNLPSSAPGYINKLSTSLRQLYVGDLKLIHKLESNLRQCIKNSPGAVDSAVNIVWTEEAEGALSRDFSEWAFLQGDKHWWIASKSVATEGMTEQDIQINFLDGTLLIAGQPLGRLPDEYSREDYFKQTLGDRVFLTYPSAMPGMSYRLANPVENHIIHLGFRSQESFLRAQDRQGRVLELIRREVFFPRDGNHTPDLPLPLIQDHAHWLDIRNRIIEIRPEKSKWRNKPKNWKIDLNASVAMRRTAYLLDPQSHIFARIANILEPFEQRTKLIVFQPEKSNIVVQLPSLELSFQVYREGLLLCRQLGAVIDVNQDAGTLYGLDSKLVLRDELTGDRMVIVAMGPGMIHKRDKHIRATTQHSGFYARFHINGVLRRLECAIEPRLVYFKAYCHAITSFVLPDPLTGRTGTEEAIAALRAGNAQPYSPLDSEAIRILKSIAELTPTMTYYPEDLKVLQKPVWDPELTSYAQHDDYVILAGGLLQKSVQLEGFDTPGLDSPSIYAHDANHLLARARARSYQFRPICMDGPKRPLDQAYPARDAKVQEPASNAFEAAFLMTQSSSRVHTTSDLSGILQAWPLIQGYQQDFETGLLTDLIDFDFASNWGSFYSLCTGSSESNRYRLMFHFATISFRREVDMDLVRTLIAISVTPEFSQLKTPKWSCYTGFRPNQVPTVDFLAQFIDMYRTPYTGDIRSEFPVAMNPKQRRQLEQIQKGHEEKSKESCIALARHLVEQWPKHDPSIRAVEDLPLLDVPGATQSVLDEWHRLTENFDLSRHIKHCQFLLNKCKAEKVSRVIDSTKKHEASMWPRPFEIRPAMSQLLSELHAFSLPQDQGNQEFFAAPCSGSPARYSHRYRDDGVGLNSLPCDLTENQEMFSCYKYNPTAAIGELQLVVNEFTRNADPVRTGYGEDLQRSIDALRRCDNTRLKAPRSDQPLIDLIMSAQSNLSGYFGEVKALMTRNLVWQQLGALLPDITPITLLETLRSTRPHCFEAVPVVVVYGHLITKLQHLLRIQGSLKRNDANQLSDEIQHVSNSVERRSDNLDWLLLQIDFNFLIRPDQLRVAEAMISPASDANSVLQMNMGLGKSSVVIPMVVTRLANKKQLARIVVPRPLLLQMGQLLQARLGGLLGRSVRHVPFSRKSRTTQDNIQLYQKLHADMLRQQGVMLTLPEHLLSFQLSGLQQLVNGQLQQADYMLKVQAWLAGKCRNVLDECDHMLAVKTQLIYPSGSQKVVDGHPLRWMLVQNLLKLLKPHVRQLRVEYPRSVEIIERSLGSFPTIYLLNEGVKDTLINRLTESILKGEGSILPLDQCNSEDLEYARSFLQDTTLKTTALSATLGFFESNIDARQHLLLLRGLLVHRILLMGIGKRYNVMYGIHPERDPIAVPYRSKGIPSDLAEFGHPDVAILLTCLSFYYSGLTVEQFQQCLGQLIKSDEPAKEFDSWIVEVDTLPASLRTWNSINVDDELQCRQLWKPLHQQMTVINYFLNFFVFPRHAKTFERKIVSSGWDIIPTALPFYDSNMSLKENIKPAGICGQQNRKLHLTTTGFSGTSDNKTLLPLNIRQNDLPGLAHTNAEVLTYLLQPRNRRYLPAADSRGRRLTEHDFLTKLKDNSIRMLLDAGALITESDNLGLVRMWLEIDWEADAAVFFGKDGRARVLYKDGKQQPLTASPFLNNLSRCVVYLDEAHTRGIDLKMPANTVAALTLGIAQTKDHTVQAAMRLRQLAKSQSVVFFAPPEVHSSITSFRNKNPYSVLNSSDVILWLLEMTCCSIEQLQPLYISQGLDYCKRIVSAFKAPDMIADSEQRASFLKVLQQPEQYSLEQLYSPNRKAKRRLVAAGGIPEIAGFVEKLNQMRRDLRDTVDTVQASAHQEVEQEREVAIEVEAVRERKNPHRATGLPQHRLHKDVERFAETGRLGVNNWSCQQALIALRLTSTGQRFGITASATLSKLYVTQDFSHTIVTDHRPRDEYSKPVHWILWSTVTDTALLVSDYEADSLLPSLRSQEHPRVHLIIYSAPVTKSMLVFDTLKVYSIPQLPQKWQAPAWLVRDLGIFAGRLYFDYDSQYVAVCQAFGLPPPTDIDTVACKELTEADLWRELPFNETPKDTGEVAEPFSKSPLLFMQEWLSVRRKGQDFSQTMMGEICRGRRLAREGVRTRDGTSHGGGDVSDGGVGGENAEEEDQGGDDDESFTEDDPGGGIFSDSETEGAAD